ncbi:MAG TPA: ribonuclease D [Hyphomicrobiaceae bacterium]|nr:ribonuclease D [Hyphomicrobiaceae bacterium]
MRPIVTTSELAQACARLRRHPFVAVDTEFIREHTFWPKLCLIQMGGPEEELIVDPLADGLDLTPFYQLMADERVTKVFHAARQDLEIVWTQAQLIPHPIFDTQVAAMVCGFGEAVSYSNLVKQVTGRDLDKTSRFTDWARRPLSQRQLTYALGDVTHLRDIYRYLRAELDKEGRAGWLDEEMAELTDPKTYQTSPEEAWRRLKLRVKNRRGLAVLIELAAWRERAAQAQDVPRNRILRDEALFDIASHAPASPAELAELRTLSEGFARSARAKEILEAVKRGLARDVTTLPALRAGQPLAADKVALLELLRVLLKGCAAREKVAPRLIADGDDLERIAIEEHPDVAAMKGWRYEMFGRQAELLKRGALALTVAAGEVVTVQLPAAPQLTEAAAGKESGALERKRGAG